MKVTCRGPMLGALKKGYSAFFEGKSKENNPYMLTSRITQAFWRRWNEGWELAKNKEKEC